MTIQTMQAHLFGALFLLSNHLQLVGDRWDEAIHQAMVAACCLAWATNAKSNISELVPIGQQQAECEEDGLILEEKAFWFSNSQKRTGGVLGIHATSLSDI